jgi:hypothetical protein
MPSPAPSIERAALEPLVSLAALDGYPPQAELRVQHFDPGFDMPHGVRQFCGSLFVFQYLAPERRMKVSQGVHRWLVFHSAKIC